MSDHNYHVDPIEKPIDMDALHQSRTAYLAVWGMGCPTCAMRVRNSLLTLDGVLFAEIYHEWGMAAVAFDPTRISTTALVEAVAAAGNDGRHHYEAKLLRQIPAADVLA
jgi:copper chaperone CopZ